jgi:hypothetical protein
MNALFGRPDVIPVSLGYSCHVKVFCEMLSDMDYGSGAPRQPFDWLGTPMWSVNEIVANDFADLTDRTKIKPRKRFVFDQTQYLTHNTYNVVYLHDYGKDIHAIPDNIWESADEAYRRRVERWHKTLASKRPILFIRLEQDKKERIKYPEFSGSVEDKGEDEAYQVERFAEMMRAKGINCMVLFLCTSYQRSYNEEKRICTVQYAKQDAKIITSGDHIMSIVQANIGFIRGCMKNLVPNVI